MGDGNVFDDVTAVNDGPIPREARPTGAHKMVEAIPSGAAEPVPIVPAAAVEHAGTPKTMPVIEEPLIEEWNGPEGRSAVSVLPTNAGPIESARTPGKVAAGSDARILVENEGEIAPVAEPRSTVPELIDAHSGAAVAVAKYGDRDAHDDELADHNDKIAEQRGLPAVAEPYVRKPPPSRRSLFASLAVSIVCIVIAGGSIMWARSEVERAGERRDGFVAAKTTDTARANVEPVAAGAPAPESASPTPSEPCALRVSTNVRGATVWIDGTSQGAAPADVPIECGRKTVVEVRHPRYELFQRALSTTGGPLAIDARLERAKTELTVSSEPPGATVTYNGRVLGKTPLVTEVSRYEQGTLRLRAPGMASESRKILPKEPAKTVSVKLERSR